jgi:branched-subunit amino acid aminotransferase/4-amino-4-deoxychorismate lyase
LGTTKDANKKGHQQVLWLYGDKKIIEVGASNIFFVFKSKNGKKA